MMSLSQTATHASPNRRWTDPDAPEGLTAIQSTVWTTTALAQPVTFSEVRSARVAELRARIAAGRYVVPASVLADSLIRSMLVH